MFNDFVRNNDAYEESQNLAEGHLPMYVSITFILVFFNID